MREWFTMQHPRQSGGVHIELDVTKLSDQRGLDFLHVAWDFETVPVGVKANFLIQVTVSAPRAAPPESDELIQAMTLLFTDVHGHTWDQTANKLIG